MDIISGYFLLYFVPTDGNLLDIEDTGTEAEFLPVTDTGSNSRKRIIIKQYLRRVVELACTIKGHTLRDRSMDRAAEHRASRFLAKQAS